MFRHFLLCPSGTAMCCRCPPCDYVLSNRSPISKRVHCNCAVFVLLYITTVSLLFYRCICTVFVLYHYCICTVLVLYHCYTCTVFVLYCALSLLYLYFTVLYHYCVTTLESVFSSSLCSRLLSLSHL